MGRRKVAWKDLLWWQGEQHQRKGARHAGRFNPALHVERSVVKVAGLDWKERAQDRGWWHSRSEDYIQQFSLANSKAGKPQT